MSELKILVGAELDESVGGKLQSQLKGLKDLTLDIEVNDSAIKQIDALADSLKKLESSGKGLTIIDTKSFGTKDLDSYAKSLENIQKTQDKMSKVDSSRQPGILNVEKMINDIGKLEQQTTRTANRIKKDLGEALDIEFDRTGFQSIEKFKDLPTSLGSGIKKLREEIEAVKKEASELYSKDTTRMDSSELQNYIGKATELQDKIKELQTYQKDMSVGIHSANTERALDRNIKQVEGIIAAWETLEKSKGFKVLDEQGNADLQRAKDAIKELQSLLDGTKDGEGIISRKDIDSANESIAKGTSLVKEQNREFGLLSNGMERFGSVATSVGGQIRSMVAQFLTLRQAIRVMKDGVQLMTDLDTTMTEVAMVTNKPREEVAHLAEEWNTTAKSMSTTTREVADASLNLFRQGLPESEVNERLNAIVKFSKVAGIEAKNAEKYVTATVNALDVTAERATDVFVSIGDSAATSGEEIAKGMSTVSGTASAMGVEFEKVASWIATVSETTREAPESIGRSMNTMLMRLQTMTKTGFDEYGASINDVADALKKAADIDLFLPDTQEMRDVGEVMDELGAKWDSLTQAEQARLSTAMAGQRQASKFLNLMENYSRSVELYDIAMGSAGTTTAKFETYQDSVEASINRVKAAWEGLSITFTNTGMIQSTLGVFESILTMLDQVVGKLGGFKTLIGGISLTTLVSGLLTGLGGKLKAAAAGTALKGVATAIGSSLGGPLGGALALAIVTAIGLGLNKLHENFKLDKIDGQAFDDIVPKLDEINRAVSASINNLQSFAIEQEGLNSIEEAVNRIKELRQESELTNEQQQELEGLNRRIAESMPELVKGRDKDGNLEIRSLELVERRLQLEREILGYKMQQESRELQTQMGELEGTQRELEETKRFHQENLNFSNLAVENFKELKKEKGEAFDWRDISRFATELRMMAEELGREDPFAGMKQRDINKLEYEEVLQLMLDYEREQLNLANETERAWLENSNNIEQSKLMIENSLLQLMELNEEFVQSFEGIKPAIEELGFEGEGLTQLQLAMFELFQQTGDLEFATNAIKEMATALSELGMQDTFSYDEMLEIFTINDGDIENIRGFVELVKEIQTVFAELELTEIESISLANLIQTGEFSVEDIQREIQTIQGIIEGLSAEDALTLLISAEMDTQKVGEIIDQTKELIAQTEADITLADGIEIMLKVEGDADEFQREVNKLKSGISEETEKVKVGLDIDDSTIDTALKALSDKKVEIEVEAKVTGDVQKEINDAISFDGDPEIEIIQRTTGGEKVRGDISSTKGSLDAAADSAGGLRSVLGRIFNMGNKTITVTVIERFIQQGASVTGVRSRASTLGWNSSLNQGQTTFRKTPVQHSHNFHNAGLSQMNFNEGKSMLIGGGFIRPASQIFPNHTMPENTMSFASRGVPAWSNYMVDRNPTITKRYMEVEADYYKRINVLLERNNNLKERNNELQKYYQHDLNRLLPLMEQESEMLKERQQLLHQNAQQYRTERAELETFLSSKGFIFTGEDDNRMISNLEKVMEFKSDSEDKDKDLKKSQEDVTKAFERYIDLQNKELPKVSNEWWKLENQIRAIAKAQADAILSDINTELGRMGRSIDTLGHQMSLLEFSAPDDFGAQADLLARQMMSVEQQSGYLQTRIQELANHGFPAGTVEAQFFNDALWETQQLLMNNQLQMARFQDQIRKLEEQAKSKFMSEWNSRMNNLAQIEDKLVDIIKKRGEEERKQIEENKRKELEALDDRRRAQQEKHRQDLDDYNNFINRKIELLRRQHREEDFEDDLAKEKEKEHILVQEYEELKLDDSLRGQQLYTKKFKELEEQRQRIADMTRDFDRQQEINFLQDKLDYKRDTADKQDKINEELYQNERDMIEANYEHQMAIWEQRYSNAAVYQEAYHAMMNGTVEYIDGSIMDVQSAIIRLEQEHGRAMGVMGNKIRQEVIAGWQDATRALSEYLHMLQGMSYSVVDGWQADRSLYAGDIDAALQNAMQGAMKKPGEFAHWSDKDFAEYVANKAKWEVGTAEQRKQLNQANKMLRQQYGMLADQDNYNFNQLYNMVDNNMQTMITHQGQGAVQAQSNRPGRVSGFGSIDDHTYMQYISNKAQWERATTAERKKQLELQNQQIRNENRINKDIYSQLQMTSQLQQQYRDMVNTGNINLFKPTVSPIPSFYNQVGTTNTLLNQIRSGTPGFGSQSEYNIPITIQGSMDSQTTDYTINELRKLMEDIDTRRYNEMKKLGLGR